MGSLFLLSGKAGYQAFFQIQAAKQLAVVADLSSTSNKCAEEVLIVKFGVIEQLS